MFVDASAIVAIVAAEDDGADLARRLQSAERRYTSPIALYEATLALLRIRGGPIGEATDLLRDFIKQAQIEIVPVTLEIGRAAVEVFARFGRGRHPAQLNMGDCFAYACARSLGVSLLYKGNDFAQTDIIVA